MDDQNEHSSQQTSSNASTSGLNCSRMNLVIPTSPFLQLACRTVCPFCNTQVSVKHCLAIQYKVQSIVCVYIHLCMHLVQEIHYVTAHRISFVWIKLVLMHQQFHALTVTITSSIV